MKEHRMGRGISVERMNRIRRSCEVTLASRCVDCYYPAYEDTAMLIAEVDRLNLELAAAHANLKQTKSCSTCFYDRLDPAVKCDGCHCEAEWKWRGIQAGAK